MADQAAKVAAARIRHVAAGRAVGDRPALALADQSADRLRAVAGYLAAGVGVGDRCLLVETDQAAHPAGVARRDAGAGAGATDATVPQVVASQATDIQVLARELNGAGTRGVGDDPAPVRADQAARTIGAGVVRHLPRDRDIGMAVGDLRDAVGAGVVFTDQAAHGIGIAVADHLAARSRAFDGAAQVECHQAAERVGMRRTGHHDVFGLDVVDAALVECGEGADLGVVVGGGRAAGRNTLQVQVADLPLVRAEQPDEGAGAI
ncbi:hypothetical protein D3C84_437910 [compost metagenome]